MVETCLCFVLADILCARQTVETERTGNHAAAEQTYACRIGVHGCDIGAESLHRATHTYVTCRTVKILCRKLCVVVCLLSHCRNAKHCEREGC